MTLTEFLLARIAEDESVVLTPARGDWSRGVDWQAGGVSVLDARWLADCDAKRRIVEEHPPTDPVNHEGDRYCRRCLAHGYDTGYPDEWVQNYYPCPTLRALAAPYATHPDYREEWKP